jgi:hypothetical protein
MASNEAFAVACIQLYSQLWAELDLVVASREPGSASRSPPPIAAVRLQILRLEILVIIDACDGTLWRTLLSSVQLRSLEATLEDVLVALAGAGGERWDTSVERAQDQLLEAVLDQCPVPSGMRASRPLFSAAS